MGKKKIKIEKIEDKAKRTVTFTKRRQGLFKKAADTCLEYDGEVAVIAFSEAGNVFTFSNTSVDSVIDHYINGVQVEEEEKEERQVQKKRKLNDDAGFWWEHIDPSKLDYERLSYLRNVLMGLEHNVRKRLDELTSSSSHTSAATPPPLLSSSFMAAKPVEYSFTPAASTSFDIPAASTSFDISAASTSFDSSAAFTSFNVHASSSTTTATDFTATKMEENHSLFLTEEDFSLLGNEAEASTPVVAASTDIASTCFDIPAASSATNVTSFTAIEMGEEEEDNLPFLTEEDFSFLANEDELPFIAERDDIWFLDKEDDFRWPLKDDVSDIANIFDEADEEGQQLASLLNDIQRHLHE